MPNEKFYNLGDKTLSEEQARQLIVENVLIQLAYNPRCYKRGVSDKLKKILDKGEMPKILHIT